MNIVGISKSMIRLSRKHARTRQKIKERAKDRNKRVTWRSDEEIHYQGLVGEFAAAAYLGIDHQPAHHAGGDNKYDFKLPDGRTVDVKFSNSLKGIFAPVFSDDPEEFKADIGILVSRVYSKLKNEYILCLWGWITREEYLSKFEIRDLGHGPRAVVTAAALHPMDSLLGTQQPVS